MSDQDLKLPVWFWVVAVTALLWNAIGVIAFLFEVNQSPESLTAMSETHRNLYESRPGWAILGFATAVFGGLLGCIALLFRRKFATVLFVVSLFGLIVQNYHSFGVAKVQNIYAENVIALPVMIAVIAIFLIWFSRSATTKKWLN